MIIDSHCHLDFPELYDNLPEILKRADDAGVKKILTICTKLKNEPQIRKISSNNPSVYYAVGTHPMSAADEPMATVDQLQVISKNPKMIGIGETGLDYFYTEKTKNTQIESFIVHIEAARKTKLPLIIHSRSADNDMIKILKKEYSNAPFDCVMHCFSSTEDLAKVALELGFYLSMSGIATFPKSENLRAIFKSTPIDRILLETDAPYLAPPPYRGKRNEPSYVVNTAKVGAELFNMNYEEFSWQTSNNFFKLFKKASKEIKNG